MSSFSQSSEVGDTLRSVHGNVGDFPLKLLNSIVRDLNCCVFSNRESSSVSKSSTIIHTKDQHFFFFFFA